MPTKVQATRLLIYNTIITTVHKSLMFDLYSRCMPLIEHLISILAPYTCSVCRSEGWPLCKTCANTHLERLQPHCYRCNAPTGISMLCTPCGAHTALGTVWCATGYHGTAKDLVAMLKFQRVKGAADVIGDWLDKQLPEIPPGVIITPVPTANKRVRMRGYDQAHLIARCFAAKRGLDYRQILFRVGATRQVGSSRHDRFRQLESAFIVRSPQHIKGKHILLIDDVLTTGATFESAAELLLAHGVKRIDAASFARA
jgi:ComF family protein